MVKLSISEDEEFMRVKERTRYNVIGKNVRAVIRNVRVEASSINRITPV